MRVLWSFLTSSRKGNTIFVSNDIFLEKILSKSLLIISFDCSLVDTTY